MVERPRGEVVESGQVSVPGDGNGPKAVGYILHFPSSGFPSSLTEQTKRARALHRQGMSEEEMAVALGVSGLGEEEREEPPQEQEAQAGDRNQAMATQVRPLAAADTGAREPERACQEQEEKTIFTRLSEVVPQPVRWFWRGRIPLGKVTVLDGDPGLGKSLLSLDLAARGSTRQLMPDGTDNHLDAPAGVVLLSAEDDPADTIRPRLEAAGADLSCIVMLSGLRDGDAVRLPTITDLSVIRDAIAQVNAKLVIVDPLMAFLPGTVDAHRDQDIRRSLAPLAALAAETGIAVLVIRHLNKNGSGNALYRGGGSIGIIGAARSGLLVAKDPEDEDQRILAVTKSNLAKLPPALAYRIAATADEIPHLVWEGPTDHTATSLLATLVDGEGRSALEEAKDFLRETLTNPRPAKDVKREAEQAGIAEHTLRRARAALGIKPVKTGRPGDEEQQWFWSLPPKMPKSAEGAHQKSMGIFG